jgi:hypothetical protein
MIAFLDESGTHTSSRVTAMAGYVITTDALPLLEKEWCSVLAEYELDELHMKEFVPPHGKHASWDNERKREMLERLIALIHRHSSVGIGAALEMTELMTTSHALAHSKSPELVHSPYQWCFRYCVQAAAWADASDRTGSIDYVLDGGCSVMGRIHEQFQLSVENPAIREKFRIGSLSFADSKQSPALQCADLLAYEMYKEADRLISNAQRAPRGSFLALFRGDDRLVTIRQDAIRQEITKGMQINLAMLGHLPAQEKFQVLCYALRHMKPENREVLFNMNPSIQAVYSACIASGEMGKRLDELSRELLPPDDPEWFRTHGVDI